MRDMLSRLRALNAETLIFTDASNPAAFESNPRAVVIPVKLSRRSTKPEELYTPIPYIIPAQIFAASLAAWKGIDPDRPRTLSKVTRTL
jgi:glucosamine--fructose-6-phosphate aminotransferase (isomerizing)